jgi:ligand-binding sensor domain-containing protein
LPSSRIESLYETPDGTLWVGTRRGPARRRGDRFQAADLEAGPELIGTWGFAADAKGSLYVATPRGLLVGHAAGDPSNLAFNAAPLPQDIPRGSVYGLHADPSGVLWFGCGRQLCRLESAASQPWGPRKDSRRSAGTPS